ncbi:uncharacterized protein LOC141719789 [Apium graveolens]|uniref:uncharacterized protein LOC141719789 n=1 Tax=Apium graveolens TaxID=4045 RepID=UPI003D7B3879
MEVRLDRVLTDENWLNNFPMAKLYNLEGAPSDHSAILLNPQVINRRARVHRFRFENAWLTEPMYEQLVREGWIEGQESNVQEKIKRCSNKLATWGKEITGNFDGRIKECKAELKRYRNGRDIVSKEKYDEARTKLDSIFNQREIFWRQRSKQLWLQAGDKNSKYFHKTASARRRNNHIQKIQDGNGNWLDWEHGLPELIMDYFSNMFAATESDSQVVVEGVPSTITNAQNEELLRPVVEEEVKEALF